ncbi:MAG: WYL domain-containing protein [Pseudomonadota bacterium]
MQTRRLKRLMRLMIEFPGREFRSAEEIYLPLGVSRSQFYRDKDELETMGFAFTYNREKGVFALKEDPGVKIEGLTLSEVLALILAVGRLPETGDFTLAYRALSGLRKITVDQHGHVAELVMQAIEQAAIQENCGCNFELLERLVEAVAEKRRIHLVYGRPDGPREWRLNVDPHRLFFRGGRLYLEAAPSSGRQRLFRTAYIKEAILTPFLYD